jgi:hypothetical protein
MRHSFAPWALGGSEEKSIAPARILAVRDFRSPVGQPDKAELPLKVVLPRGVLDRLMVRAHREENPSLAALVQTVLVREGKAGDG